MKDLTKGYPAKVIILFAIPMIFGSIFQQLYNIADSKIVSTFVGTEAFAAVGATKCCIEHFNRIFEFPDTWICDSDCEQFWRKGL